MVKWQLLGVELEKRPDEVSKVIETRKSKPLTPESQNCSGCKIKMTEALTSKLLKQRTDVEHV
jgi:hypothetical protein